MPTLEQVKKLRMYGTGEGDDLNAATPDAMLLERVKAAQAKAPEVTRPDVLAQSPYLQAAELTRQAELPKPDPFQGMTGWKRILAQGMLGAAEGSIHANDPGGYNAYLEREQARERQGKQDLLARAKELRGEGRQQSVDYAALQNDELARERQARIDAVNEENVRSQIAARGVPTTPQGFDLSPGQVRFDPTGKEIAHVPLNPAQVNPEIERHNRAMEQAALLRAKNTGAGPTAASSSYASQTAARTIQAVDNLIGQVGGWTAGTGSILANIPGTDARNFRAQLDTLKANIAFNELAAMREASKTGGALGQISDREEALLSSVLGALDAGQSPEVLKGQLMQIKESVQRWQTAQAMQGAGNPNVTVQNAPGSPVSPSAGSTKLKRTSKRTGEVQFSDDGGKTWHN